MRSTQEQYEESSDAFACAEKLMQIQRDTSEGSADTVRARAVIARAHAGVAHELENVKERLGKCKGQAGVYGQWLVKVSTDVLAAIAVRECLSKCLQNPGLSLQSLCIHIGALYELEAKLVDSQTISPKYMQKVFENAEGHFTQSKWFLRGKYLCIYEKLTLGALDAHLSNTAKLQLGKHGVEACVSAGLIELHRSKGNTGTVKVHAVPEVFEFIQGVDSSDVRYVLDSTASAMLAPPDPWTCASDGGYYSTRRKALCPLMKTKNLRTAHKQIARDALRATHMPVVFNAVNALQSVPYSVNTAVLEHVQRMWQAGGGVMGVPSVFPPKKPPCPLPEHWSKKTGTEEELKVFGAWKAKMRELYTVERTWKGKVLEVQALLRTIARQEDKMYFPAQLDTRGRMYYRGIPNPQGNDISRACMQFHEKKTLGKDGLYWLKVSIANAYGYDEVHFHDRVRWVDQNLGVLFNALECPEDHADAFGDKPLQCLSAVLELQKALASPDPLRYKSGFIVFMDATCSGLQHFSALLRDPIGAKYVNLMPVPGAQKKQDIYTKVAECALGNMDDSLPGVFWKEYGVPRKIAKKPVMTYVYGATLKGTADFIEGILMEEPDCDEFSARPRALYLAKHLFKGIAETVPAAAACMRWFRGIPKGTSKDEVLTWRSPSGFLVHHDYCESTKRRVFIRSCGVNVVVVYDNTEQTHRLHSTNAIAPNFVHSMDAAHLALVACAMHYLGLRMSAVHDSFGTHACDVSAMHKIIREEFVKMYSSDTILQDFITDVKQPGVAAPAQGSFDVRDVLGSPFFFC